MNIAIGFSMYTMQNGIMCLVLLVGTIDKLYQQRIKI